ncbi:preprotein translocase subunit YajC [Paracoccus alkenifer]|uniref:Sec translocon accessory complex subunit YajC n=1 Tax=Paracoccus alkenifer TaxID=65735 RepID=A0A1H6JV53_9RHOB|nr:preprotein translocase subunit YajC [Paracoccus alkenifer]SEH63150.1 preprotein translocase subunit YajC [Paracoccus alkenifer]
MLITPAYAQAAAPAAGGGAAFAQFIPLILVFVIMYFLIMRPQQKKMSQHRAMVAALKKGDNVVTQGGIFGKVVAVRDDDVDVEIAQGVRIRVVRATIAQVVDRAGAPAAANS